MALDAASAEAYKAPFPDAVNVEALMARSIVQRVIAVGPAIVAVAWFWRGSLGASSAAIGVAVIAVNFLLSGWLLSRAATISMQAYHVAAVFGFFLRLGFITVSMFAVATLFEVDRRSLGIAAIAAFLVLLILESIAMLRGARKDLEWS
ncbi:MAG: hypothetical protein BMS9Abin17_0522 [Acidimicrobiia bacterium]|nr:MAG: hypothetical protein BMS9Abin17_0522 [Acidimicrobiia bacterium]